MALLDQKTIEYIIRVKDEATKNLSQISNHVEKTQTDLRAAGVALSAVGAAGAVAVKELGGFAGQLQMTTRAFESLTGSGVVAKDLLQDLSDFARKTPFTLVGARDAAKRLLAFGFAAEEILPTMKDVGDASAAVGLDDAGFTRLIWNLGQVRAKGKLTGIEIRDFGSNAIPIIDQLAESFGKTKQEIYEMSEGGSITPDMVIKAFNDMASEGGRFADFMEKNVGTLPQVISNLGDSLSILAEKLGKPLIVPLSFAAEKITTLANALGAFVELHPRIAAVGAALLLVGTAFAMIAGPVLIFISFLPQLIAGFKAFGTLIQLTSGLLTALASPVLATVAVLGVLGVAAYSLYRLWEENFLGMKDLTQQWADFTTILVENIKYIWERFDEWFRILWDNVKAGVTAFYTWAMEALPVMTGTLVESLQVVWISFGEFMKVFLGNIGIVLVGFLAFVYGIFTGAGKTQLEIAFWTMMSGWANIVKGIANAVVGAVEGMINIVLGYINRAISAIVPFKGILKRMGIDIGEMEWIPEITLPRTAIDDLKVPTLSQLISSSGAMAEGSEVFDDMKKLLESSMGNVSFDGGSGGGVGSNKADEEEDKSWLTENVEKIAGLGNEEQRRNERLSEKRYGGEYGYDYLQGPGGGEKSVAVSVNVDGSLIGLSKRELADMVGEQVVNSLRTFAPAT